MRNYVLGVSGLLLIATCSLFTAWKNDDAKQADKRFSSENTLETAYIHHARSLYQSAHLKDSGLSFPVFEKALTGYYNLKKAGLLSDHALLSIADFDQPSTSKRLYVLNVDQRDVVLNTWVAHGQRSGENQAVTFSNQNDSFASSIGFFVTGEEYHGTHGRSLKLDGMDPGFNDNARLRSIVIHGAPYVSEGTIAALGRLGRSQGCPAVAPELADPLISSLGEGSVLFINKSSERYASTFLNEESAYLAMMPEINDTPLYGNISNMD
ncbi:murein L,D-transpeptidase catalytic domain family protein [Pedobacter sp. GR22-10]|uniref:murein L,D-transpeptidase catalytic domain family protein n=1 Tax=Pedobacter sp. GR22-10 TaxID=2994472 RepID=UPI002245B1E4|nr:murein L,D-transpeptidase catalytic domain family protein [Pedobacter sp. GR22-10]MCX2431375.1 murein L,D-transpeptidase catalytic domain family protein [Pedobacter sp. GR22-10]